MNRFLVSLAAILFSSSSAAKLIEIDYAVDLEQGVVYDCIDASRSSTGQSQKCWTNLWENATFPGVTISGGSTLRLDISFLPGQKFRWWDDGATFNSGTDEAFQIGLTSSVEDFTVKALDYRFSFNGVTGNDLSPGSWAVSPYFNRSSGAIVRSEMSGAMNLTDSYFDFTGLTVEIDLVDVATKITQQDTAFIDGIYMFFFSGEFESFIPPPMPPIARNLMLPAPAISVSEAPAYLLTPLALLVLAGRRRHQK
ncbi:hypothetical protein ACFSJY_15250 [Thalassotalea euphylliae]|uniref:hypothetical protein n=1 Tax=Thalassotalea euphylliae TaxID=1655234 RepID=UPI0036270EE1